MPILEMNSWEFCAVSERCARLSVAGAFRRRGEPRRRVSGLNQKPEILRSREEGSILRHFRCKLHHRSNRTLPPVVFSGPGRYSRSLQPLDAKSPHRFNANSMVFPHCRECFGILAGTRFILPAIAQACPPLSTQESFSRAITLVSPMFPQRIQLQVPIETKAPMNISSALSTHLGNMGYFFMPNTASFAALATRNFTTVFAGI